MASKEKILDAIRSIAVKNGGKAPGKIAFENETGISEGAWRGRHWARWSEAIAEAGLQPNMPPDTLGEKRVLAAIAKVALQCERIPTFAELSIAQRSDETIPNVKTIQKYFPTKAAWVKALFESYQNEPECKQLTKLCEEYLVANESEEKNLGNETSQLHCGEVYLAEMSGKREKWYKVGKAIDSDVRIGQIASQLPEKLKKIHSIKTDDAFGIEAYWHKRFGDRRREGEWFQLTQADLKAFKKRKFQ